KKRDKSRRKTALLKRKWPTFLFDVENGTPRFVEEIKKAVEDFRFDELPELDQQAFRDLKSRGAHWARKKIEADLNKLKDPKSPQDHPGHRSGEFSDIFWVLRLGTALFQKVPEAIRSELLPFNDARFHYVGNDVIVEFRSLLQVKT